MQQLIEGLWREHGFTVLLVTHDVSEAVAVADRVILIEDGEIGLDLPVELPRPRSRGSARLAALEAEVLNRVLAQPELPPQPGTRFTPAHATALGALTNHASFRIPQEKRHDHQSHQRS